MSDDLTEMLVVSSNDNEPLSPTSDPTSVDKSTARLLENPNNEESNFNIDSPSSQSIDMFQTSNQKSPKLWTPSGIWYKDFLHFVGPGWFVSIAYVDPGNYQADIQAGSLSRYNLLCIIWWTSILSIYVQVLCVRLAHHSGMTLAEAQAKHSSGNAMRYLNWFIAEFSIVITDLPEVIGIGIACNIFFGWPYWVGVLSSLLTTMIFLSALNFGTMVLEIIVAGFVAVMAIALFVEMGFVGADVGDIMEGWAVGFKDLRRDDLFAITGVVGAVVMPHNLYLHTAACQSRRVEREHTKTAVFYASVEPIAPILLSFFINLAVVTVAAERAYGTVGVADLGITNFCQFFDTLVAGCSMWGIALLAAGQSSAITTTYTGQYVMDGFLNLRLSVKMRAIVTRLVAITPCIIVSVLFPNQLNHMVNIVNAALSFLLPFAFTPLVKFNCSKRVMGEENAAKGYERFLLYFFAFAVWSVNAIGLSATGGGFFGDLRGNVDSKVSQVTLIILEVSIQIFYLWWNINCLISSDHAVIDVNSQINEDIVEMNGQHLNGGESDEYPDNEHEII